MSESSHFYILSTHQRVLRCWKWAFVMEPDMIACINVKTGKHASILTDASYSPNACVSAIKRYIPEYILSQQRDDYTSLAQSIKHDKNEWKVQIDDGLATLLYNDKPDMAIASDLTSCVVVHGIDPMFSADTRSGTHMWIIPVE